MEPWKHLRAILLLPGMVTVVIPATILASTGHSSPTNIALLVLGLLLIVVGLVFMAVTIRLFVTVGQGTLAPWNPPQHFVAHGIYRHVRNPMISGVFSILLGETLLAASLPLLCWFLFFVVGNAIYIPMVEEPGLVKRFGEGYEVYRRNVPRWIPRLTAWEQPEAAGPL